MRLNSFIRTFVAVSIGIAPNAILAQIYNYGSNVEVMIQNQHVWAMDMNILTARNLQKQPRKSGNRTRAQTAPSHSETALLTFVVDSDIASKIRKHYIDNLAKEDPVSAREYAKIIRTQDVPGNFRNNLAAFGLDSHNVGDVLTAYWVILWSIANKQSTTAISEASVRTVRKEVTTAMLSDPYISGMSERERQSVAELMMYDTVLADASYRNAHEQQRSDLVNVLSDTVYRRVKDQGTDLRAMKLTDAGFQRR